MSSTSSARSPLKEKPLPRAGASTYEQFMLGLYEIGFCLTIGILFLPLMAMEWLHFFGVAPMPRLFTCCALGCGVVAIWRGRRQWQQMKQLAMGFKGECAVADALDQLRDRGYRVFHDVREDTYNIDHVLIGPGGVFAIETKTHSKRKGAKVVVKEESITVGGFTPDRDPIVQAKASARRIRDVLKQQTGLAVWVKPVVLYPGWYVEHKTKPTNDLFIGSEAFFIGSFDYQHAEELLSPEDVDALARGMESYLRR